LIDLFLAGGLSPENVPEAIRSARPFGVDVCSSIRTNGRLDRDKLTRLVETIERTDAELMGL
jgi:phosphoribosylanthranilate isomerase